ncbi:HK97-gp10 family putative phage morphogenesis protein [Franconibacter pulveris 601]|uniref:HK97-gp10 family putative phage morphogenesis protein n=1 Tax=Franconibacter pulveris TaxID=435910 RepID=UPI000465B735|nr:HK97-gp10 family putative phage morphogenesis protein [Franconibacter pulveris]
MADGIDLSIAGLDSLLGKLDSISDDLRRRGGRAALRKAANVIVTKAQENAASVDDPLTKESISKNIVARWSNVTFRRTGNLAFRIGVLGGAISYADSRENRRKGRAGRLYFTPGSSKNPGGNTWYWRFLEFGTEKMRAQPFMRPAAESSINEVVNTFATEYEKAIDRAIKRAQKKGVPP